MKTIYKYPTGTVNMHQGAVVLAGQSRNSKFYIWAEVDTTLPLTERHFVVYGTGWEISDNSRYITTIIDGECIWHVYEVI